MAGIVALVFMMLPVSLFMSPFFWPNQSGGGASQTNLNPNFIFLNNITVKRQIAKWYKAAWTDEKRTKQDRAKTKSSSYKKGV